MNFEFEKYKNLFFDFIAKIDWKTLSKGEVIFDNGKIHQIYYDPNHKEFKAKVRGSRLYEVTFKADPKFKKIIGECSCPYYGDICKHQSAAARSILVKPEKVRLSDNALKEAMTGSSLKLKVLKKEKTYSITYDTLEDLFLYYRLLPSDKYELGYNEAIYQALIGEQKVRSTIYRRHGRWSIEERTTHECEINWDKDKILIKCKDCSLDKKICGLAHYSLKNLIKIYRNQGSEILDYNALIKKMSEQEDISENILKKIGKISIKKHGASLTIADKNLVSEDTLQLFTRKIDEHKKIRVQNSINALKGRLDKKEAFVWSHLMSTSSFDLLFIIEGKANKNGDKLISGISEIDQPRIMSTSSIDFFENFRAYNFKVMDYEDLILNRVLISKATEFLQEHIALLRSNIHYYHAPSDYYYGYHDLKLLKKDLRLFTFTDQFIDIKIIAEIKDELYTITLQYFVDGINVDLTKATEIKLTQNFLIIEGKAYIYKNINTLPVLSILEYKSLNKFLPKHKLEFYRLLNELNKYVEVHQEERLEDAIQTISNLEKSIHLSEAGNHIIFRPTLSNEVVQFDLLDIKPTLVDRDIAMPNPFEEGTFKNQFSKLHKAFEQQLPDINFTSLHTDSYIRENWHLQFFEKCKELNIAIHGLENFERIKFSPFKAEIETDLTSKIDWFELNVSLTFGAEKVSRKKWIKALKEGKNYVELKDGTIGLLPENWVFKMSKILNISDISGQNLQINKLRFNVLDDLFKDIANKSILKEIATKRKLIKSFKAIDQKRKIPKIIKAELRPYQEASYHWMHFLKSSGFGGILADDMGLGKTLQIICILAEAKERKKCNALVIVPRSLIFNWEEEIEKFCPSLTHHIHHGTQRHLKEEKFEKADIIITTYGTAVNDIEALRNIAFTHIILDESQAIKNPTSKRYKAIRLLQSPFKLCATGTPIQNNTFDLYTQVSFTNPGLLGNQSYFSQNFAKPIDKDQDQEAARLLQKMIHPFLLRRTKEQVAKELPEKTESIIYCEMPTHQRKMYEELKQQIRTDLLSLDEEDSQLKFKVLDGLLRLRQLCNSPLLVHKNLSGKKAASIKIESLLYKLTEEIGDGNALVFSQFVQMLSLIRKELDALGIPYAYLDGQTRDRKAVVKQFMEDDACRIFLISLKAGNTGLNLTKAQYVFLIDPWWNPAAEAQAIDRTHRIGQTQKVFAYKMICKDTIEEKIVTLQMKKKRVAKQLIQVDESTFKSMKKEDLMALFD